MADSKKPQLEKFVTPAGIAVWPRLHEPDTKFKPEGEYTAKIRLSADDAQPLIDRIETLIEETMAKAKTDLNALAKDPKEKAKALKRLKELKLADKSYRPTLDDDANETGEVEFNIKMKAKVTNKKTGKVTKLTPKLFDSKGNPLPSSVQIWGGTTYKVAGRYNPYVSPKGEVGVSLRLEAVQVKNLVSAGSGGNSESYGFVEEDGFVAEGSEFNDDSGNDSEGGTEEGSEGDDDF